MIMTEKTIALVAMAIAREMESKDDTTECVMANKYLLLNPDSEADFKLLNILIESVDLARTKC